ncbi:MAG: hypothetical protein Kapaf2KO_00330 [Candidatus Kapaibacteriales bacterium]
MQRKKFDNIVKSYRESILLKPDTWILLAKQQESLDDAIRISVLSKNVDGKKHYHQRRKPNSILTDFSELLISESSKIESSRTFDELLKTIEDIKIKGIGEVACYDTAYRIGNWLELSPEHIYMHAGTKIGAEKILKCKLSKRYIEKSELPNYFSESDLSPVELEDILCIYKNIL